LCFDYHPHCIHGFRNIPLILRIGRSGVWISVGARDFSNLHKVRNDSGAHSLGLTGQWATLTGVNRPRRGHVYRESGATPLLPLYASMAWKRGAFTSIVYHRRRTIDRAVKTLLYPSLCRSEETLEVRKKGCKEYRDIKAPWTHVKEYDAGSTARITVELGSTHLGRYKFWGSKWIDLSLEAKLFFYKILHAKGYYELLCVAAIVRTVSLRTAILTDIPCLREVRQTDKQTGRFFYVSCFCFLLYIHHDEYCVLQYMCTAQLPTFLTLQ
jgi:hypothetical protein